MMDFNSFTTDSYSTRSSLHDEEVCSQHRDNARARTPNTNRLHKNLRTSPPSQNQQPQYTNNYQPRGHWKALGASLKNWFFPSMLGLQFRTSKLQKTTQDLMNQSSGGTNYFRPQYNTNNQFSSSLFPPLPPQLSIFNTALNPFANLQDNANCLLQSIQGVAIQPLNYNSSSTNDANIISSLSNNDIEICIQACLEKQHHGINYQVNINNYNNLDAIKTLFSHVHNPQNLETLLDLLLKQQTSRKNNENPRNSRASSYRTNSANNHTHSTNAPPPQTPPNVPPAFTGFAGLNNYFPSNNPLQVPDFVARFRQQMQGVGMPSTSQPPTFPQMPFPTSSFVPPVASTESLRRADYRNSDPNQLQNDWVRRHAGDGGNNNTANYWDERRYNEEQEAERQEAERLAQQRLNEEDEFRRQHH